MKRYLAAVLFYLPVFMTGCISQDWSLCEPDDNCLLRYRYQDENGTDIFSGSIGSVDLVLFDVNGNYVAQYHSGPAELAEFRGVTLALDPGDYYAVAWGNLGEEANKNVTTLTESTLEIEDGNGGLPLYYAPYVTPITRTVTTGAPAGNPDGNDSTPAHLTGSHHATRAASRSDQEMAVYTITVPKRGMVERDLNFTRANRSINVYVKGFEDPQSGPDPAMEVEISHLAYAYDFLLRVSPFRRSHTSVTELKDTPAGIIPGTRVNTPYQEIEDEINISIKTTNGTEVCPRINLKQYLLQEGLGLDALSLHEITVLLSYENGQVTITVPDWGENIVGPIL